MFLRISSAVQASRVVFRLDKLISHSNRFFCVCKLFETNNKQENNSVCGCLFKFFKIYRVKWELNCKLAGFKSNNNSSLEKGSNTESDAEIETLARWIFMKGLKGEKKLFAREFWVINDEDGERRIKREINLQFV